MLYENVQESETVTLNLSLTLSHTHTDTHTHTRFKRNVLQLRGSPAECVGSARTALTDPSGGQHTPARANTADTTALSITDTGTPRSPRCTKYSTTAPPVRIVYVSVRVRVIECEAGFKQPCMIPLMERQPQHCADTHRTDHPDWRTHQEIRGDSQRPRPMGWKRRRDNR